jgi:hypothetical protein
MWIDQYKKLEDINFNTIDINKVMQDAKSIEIELESMKSAITQYNSGIKDKVTIMLQDMLGLSDELYITSIDYTETKMSFSIRLKIIETEINQSSYMTESNIIRLMYQFKVEGYYHSKNELLIESDSNIVGSFRKMREGETMDFYHKKYKIVSTYTDLMSKVLHNYDKLANEIIFDLRTLAQTTYDSIGKINSTIYGTLNAKQNFAINIIKEHNFYKFINQALKDFAPIHTTDDLIKITKITPSGKTLEFTRRWTSGENAYDYKEKMLVKNFRNRYDL